MVQIYPLFLVDRLTGSLGRSIFAFDALEDFSEDKLLCFFFFSVYSKATTNSIGGKQS